MEGVLEEDTETAKNGRLMIFSAIEQKRRELNHLGNTLGTLHPEVLII